MPKKKQGDDIATRAHVLRSRIYTLEKKLATAYPDHREPLAQEIDALVEEYTALVPAIQEEAEKRKAELLRDWYEVNNKRLDLLRLLGHSTGANEPVPKDANGMARQMGDPRWPFTFAQKLDLAPLEHYPESTWDQRKRNEKAGHGYLTDAAVAGKDSITYQHGAGASIQKFPNLGGDR